MSKTEDVLAQIPLFHGLNTAQLRDVGAVTRDKHCRKGEVIIREGDEGEVMYILTKGSVEVSRTVTLNMSHGNFGEVEKSITRLDAQEYPCFGEMALLERSLRGATVTAVSDCELLEIPQDDFDHLCGQHPLIGYIVTKNMASQLSARLRRTNQDVLKLTTALSLALNRARV